MANMSDIQIHLDEDNELTFGITVEGARLNNITCRMVLESPNSPVGIIFPARPVQGNEVRVIVPALKSFLNEGIYPVKLEVLVDDRIFTPLSMNAELKNSMRVTAEAHKVRKNPVSNATSVLSESNSALNLEEFDIDNILSQKKLTATLQVEGNKKVSVQNVRREILSRDEPELNSVLRKSSKKDSK